jgi:hypothetical protein
MVALGLGLAEVRKRTRMERGAASREAWDQEGGGKWAEGKGQEGKRRATSHVPASPPLSHKVEREEGQRRSKRSGTWFLSTPIWSLLGQNFGLSKDSSWAIHPELEPNSERKFLTTRNSRIGPRILKFRFPGPIPCNQTRCKR